MPEFFEALSGGVLWGVGFGLAMGAVRMTGGGLRPLAKGAIDGGVALTDWVRNTTEESRESLQDLYQEAKAERQTAG